MNHLSTLLSKVYASACAAMCAVLLLSGTLFAQDASRALYDDLEKFEQLSGAAQNMLRAKFGPHPGETKPDYRPMSDNGPVDDVAPLLPLHQGGGWTPFQMTTLVNNADADATAQDTQSETTIILGSGSNVIAGFNDSGSFIGGASKFTGFSTSTDGGTTWVDGGTLPTNAFGDGGDPVLARDNTSGRVYFATLQMTSNGMQMFRSDDNGATWMAPVQCAPGATDFQDKEWITVDNFAGSGQGNVYHAYRDFAAGGGIRFTKSTDQGATFGPSPGLLLKEGSLSNVQGAQVAVGSDHSVYVFWYDQHFTPRQIRMSKSTDQGATFGPEVSVATLTSTFTNGGLTLPAGFRSNSFPQVVVNEANGDLYVVYNDPTAVSGGDRGNIFFRQSTDGGATWSTAVQLNDDGTTRAQYMPAIAVKPDGSGLAVTWYDNRSDPADINIERWGITATIAGSTVTFGTNFQVGPQFTPVFGVDPVVNSVYMGDYDMMAADNTNFYSTWADNRDQSIAVPARKNANIRFVSFPLGGPVPTAELVMTSRALTGGNGNGSIDQNECNDLTFTVKNDGLATATAISGTLSSTTPGVTITTATQPFGTLAVGASAANTFKVNTAPGLGCVTIDFILTLSYTEGSDVLPFSSPTCQSLPTSIASTLGSPTPGVGYTVTTGLQTLRLIRDGVASTCASPKPACPGVFATTGTRVFDAYTFTNGLASACVTITLTQNTGTANAFFSTSYLGSFVPATVCTNYLADAGASASSRTYQAVVPANGTLVVVVHEVNAAGGTGATYTVNVSGLSSSDPDGGGGCELTAAPTVDSPIASGATSVSGTSTEADGTVIDVFVNSSSVGTTTVTGGVWTKSGLVATNNDLGLPNSGPVVGLLAGDTVKANAKAFDKQLSGYSNEVIVQDVTTAPVVTSPIAAGATSVSGTGPESAITRAIGGIKGVPVGTEIEVLVNSASVGTTNVNPGGSWTKSGLAGLVAGDTVKATATATGKLTSTFSNQVIVQDVTAAPVVTSPITAGATSVSGTGPEAIITQGGGPKGPLAGGTIIEVFRNSISVGTTSVNTGGSWTKSGLAPLVAGDTVKAKATALLKLPSPFSNEVIVEADAALEIHDIQGSGHISPYVGQIVTTATSTVTAVGSNGFYMQSPNPDADENTSEGIFVFTSSPPSASVGDNVSVTGTVAEFRAGGGASANLTITEITSPSSIVNLSTGNPLPAAIVLGNGGRAIPAAIIEDDASGDVETSGTFDPATDGIDFYETLEGMLVQINSPLAVSLTNFDEIWVLADNGVNATGRTVRGGSLLSGTDSNPERIQIDGSLPGVSLPIVNVGAQLSTVVGIVNYSFGNFEVLPFSPPSVVTPSALTKESTVVIGAPDKLTVATLDLNNLDPGDNAARFTAFADMVTDNLQSPDIVIVTTIQDNNGPVNDNVVDASFTFQTLINAIITAGGPTYQYRQIDPVDDQDGGEPGGNIRQGFLFNPIRVSFVDLPGGTGTTATIVSNVGGVPALSVSPGRIDPTNAAFNSSRKPLIGEFTFNGNKVFVIGTHLNSKGGDSPLFGRYQPPLLVSEVQRNQQATIIRNFVQSILAIDATANVVAGGDYNDFEFSNPLSILESAPLNTLTETLPANERYGFIFDGNAFALGHILASNNLLGKLDGYDIVHAVSEFNDQIAQRDPIVSRFILAPPPPSSVLTNGGFESGTSPWVFYTNGTGNYTLSAPGANGAGNAAKVTVNTTGNNTQLYQFGITLLPNTQYTLTFKARSTTGHNLAVFVHRHDAPYNNYGLNGQVFDLTNAWTTYTVDFTTVGFPPPTPSNARLRFAFNGLATPGDQYFIDDVSLVSLGSPLTAAKVRVETAPDGGGSVVPAQTIENGETITMYAISRTATDQFVANVPAAWTLTDISGAVLPGDLAPSIDGKSAVFTGNADGAARVKAASGPLTTISSQVITVFTPPPPTNILVNGGFESGTTNWLFNTNGAGSFTAVTPGNVGAKAGQVSIITQGTIVQLYQFGIPLTSGNTYRLSFRAFSNTGHDLQVSVFKHGSPFTPYGLTNQFFNLTNTWASYSVDFTAIGFAGTATDARLRFWFAPYDVAGDVYQFDDVKIELLPAPPDAENPYTTSQALSKFTLNGNFPNPFNPSTTIIYTLPVDARVTLDVYDVLGQRVAQLVDGTVSAGYHDAVFDASTLSSGLYLYRLTAVGTDGVMFTRTEKMLLTK